MKWVKGSYFLGFISLVVLLCVFQYNKSNYEETENLLHSTYVAKDKIKDIKDSFYEIDIQLVSYSINLNEVDRYIIAKDLLDLEDNVRDLNQILLEIAKYEEGRDVLDFLIQVDNRHFVDYFISRESTLSFINKKERVYQGKIKNDLTRLEQVLQNKIDTILQQREMRRDVVRSYYMFLIGLSLCSFTLYAWSMQRETKRRSVLLRQLEMAVSSSKKNLELKNQFVANISHEIRTPLNGIIGVSKLLKENIDTEKRDFYLDLINNSGNLLLKIVNDLLDFSKADANKIELELAEFDLINSNEQVLGMHLQKVKNKSLRIYAEYDPKIKHKYLGDQSRVIQIISNLVGNAIKFTDNGYVQIKLQMQKENIAEGVDLIKCEVIDTGIGISEEDMELLFQPFNQIKNKHSGEGTGLGLAISKRLVNLMNGKIGVSKTDGNQTVFWFSIPLKRMNMRPKLELDANNFEFLTYNISSQTMGYLNTFANQFKIKQSAFSSKSNINNRSIVLLENEEDLAALKDIEIKKVVIPDVVSTNILVNKLKENFVPEVVQPIKVVTAEQVVEQPLTAKSCKISILLVEDNITNQILAQELLEKKGYRVTIANDGREAIEKIQDISFDLVLMDCQMPVLGGIEATEEIRRDQKTYPKNKNLPIIAMTANAMKTDFEKCIAAGMNNYISKPFDIDELDLMIKNAILECGNLLSEDFKNKLDDYVNESNVLIFQRYCDELISEINQVEFKKDYSNYLVAKDAYLQMFKEALSNRSKTFFNVFEESINSDEVKFANSKVLLVKFITKIKQSIAVKL